MINLNSGTLKAEKGGLTAKLVDDWLLHKLVTLFLQHLNKFMKLRNKSK